jgi:prolyl oligopeptidase PreP (S9A serine peptidase family)
LKQLRDVVSRKITSPQHIEIEGRSNGGLLAMALIVRHSPYQLLEKDRKYPHLFFYAS